MKTDIHTVYMYLKKDTKKQEKLEVKQTTSRIYVCMCIYTKVYQNQIAGNN